MRIDMITLFPEMFAGPFGASITKRAVEKGILDIHFTNFRDYSFDKHRHVDDSPFGGGAGMVLKPEPMYRAVRAVLEETAMHAASRRVLIMDPAGPVFTQAKAKELASYEQLVFICGHYEGFDARIYPLADEAISIGDFVLTGGELPAMVITDAVSRMLPGVLGDAESAPTDSFYDGLLGFPQYTRPRDFEGMEVPEVLLSGDHAKIRQWRHEQSLRLTKEKRPDLLAKKALSDEDREILRRFEGFGLPLHFTENTLVSGHLMPPHIVDLNDYQIPEWPSTPEGEARQAREWEEMYRILFDHPLVQAVTGWDFADGMWLGAPSGVIARDNREKPAYRALQGLIHGEWETHGDVVTDANGCAEVTGFKGGYALTDGQRAARFRLDGPNAVDVILA